MSNLLLDAAAIFGLWWLFNLLGCLIKYVIDREWDWDWDKY